MAAKNRAAKKSNPLRELGRRGQSLWFDYISRRLVASGDLAGLIREDGLRGMTSNPTIFEKAITAGTDYDETLREMLAAEPRAAATTLYETLAIADIRMAADALRGVYEESRGSDGFVSLEVSPRLARDTAGTIAEARRLWQAVSRPNLMIKVPATRQGIPAIEALIGEGININVTLMFSLAHYEAVARAYIRGLDRCPQPGRVRSVASFFVSRVDTLVDRALEQAGTPVALALRGQVAVANSRLVYRRFGEIFRGSEFASLRQRGAQVQRPLWASTGTKNPAYSDVLYVEELVGSETVNTLPPATWEAFRDHGKVRGDTVLEGDPAAVLASLAASGIDLDAVAEKLQEDGVAAFSRSFEELLAALEEKRKRILAAQVGSQTLSLGAGQASVDGRLGSWQESALVGRAWRKDPAVWSADERTAELRDRLGWLTLPEVMIEQAADLAAFAEEIRSAGIRHAVLMGMGGSSLAPEVFQRTFGSGRGCPELIVLDSTHPDAVRAVDRRIDPQRTLFLVSSKSGTTTEPLAMFYYFWERAGRQGDRFITITDPGTPLEQMARRRGFRRVFAGTPDVGGRYSALSMFGLVPAALIGIDVRRLLTQAWRMAQACALDAPAAMNPGAALGAALGELALAGRDKVTFLASPSLASLPDWIEQLIAESTGKAGKGVVPIAGEVPGNPEVYGPDRLFVALSIEGEEDDGLREKLPALEASGHPVIRIRAAAKEDLGQEFFRWEMATALAGAVLGINPFNQPDVQLAKELARNAMQGTGAGRQGADDLIPAGTAALGPALATWIGGAAPGDYIGLQAYLAPTRETTDALEGIRLALRDRLRVATTAGYGPRFLHSTGQLHKGGPGSGMFLQLVDDPVDDLEVPETGYTFGTLIRAQAAGDAGALLQRGRRLLRVNLGSDTAGGLRRIGGILGG